MQKYQSLDTLSLLASPQVKREQGVPSQDTAPWSVLYSRQLKTRLHRHESNKRHMSFKIQETSISKKAYVS